MRAESLAYKNGVSEGQHCAVIRRIADTLSEEFGPILANGRLRYGTAQMVLAAAEIQANWTASDSEDEYLFWIAAIRRVAEGVSLAEWEHRVWLGGECGRPS